MEVTALTNGNYVVDSPFWSNTQTSFQAQGAVTWGNGTMGISGPISAANSLVGSEFGDQVGGGPGDGDPLGGGGSVASLPLPMATTLWIAPSGTVRRER